MSSLRELKKLIRSDMKLRLDLMNEQSIAIESNACCRQIFETDMYKASKAISVFLSMPNEIQTLDILENAFSSNKRVYIPKIIGPNPRDMVMVEIGSTEEVDRFPKSKWGIPEPQIGAEFLDGTGLGVIDLIFVPGVAFDRRCGRVGHGKGYYGKIC